MSSEHTPTPLHGDVQSIPVEEIGQWYGRYRLHHPAAERAMAGSLQSHGQMAPVVVCVRDGRFELIDGFKRLRAARRLAGFATLEARVADVDDTRAKAAMWALNRVGGRLQELEEGWIVRALVHDDGLSQVEVARLLGRHKSWVCRRLALIDRLCEEAQQELQVGLLTPSAARELARLPAGNQVELLSVARREELTADELRRVVHLVIACPDGASRVFVLSQPREALRRSRDEPATPRKDPRLSGAGNRLNRELGLLLGAMPRLDNALRHRRRLRLTPTDVALLEPSVRRMADIASCLAEAASDFTREASSP